MTTDKKRAYTRWLSIKSRCYNQNNKDFKSYGAKGVKLCDEWLNFENFYKWYSENYYSVDGEYMAVDKDILGNGSKIYSPETCIIVPYRINGMLVHKDVEHIGVKKVSKKYEVKVRNTITGKNEYCGCFSSVEQASEVYKKCKTIIFRAVVESYKGKLPDSVYNVLINYSF